jgi:hypothetical protein
MGVTVVHGIVALAAESNQIPTLHRVLRIALRWVDVVNVITAPHPAVALALLALIAIPTKDG